MRRWIVALAALSVTPFVTAQEQTAPELQALVDTERAFARAATVKGLRDSFLDYFAVRVWTRDASGKWLVVVDVTQPV